jgi:hypothetical protein
MTRIEVPMLRAVTTVSAVAAVTLGAGCEWLDRMKTKDAGVKTAGGPVEAKTAADLVGYLNWQANSIQSVRSNDVYIELQVGKDKERWTLNDSSLVCAKPRNFLLVGGRPVMSNIVQIGSNEREFWMAAKLPDPGMYVYCSHADFPQAGDRMPFPFDPDWALQALGMSAYRPELNYTIKTDEKAREHQLWYDTTTPQGTPVRRVVAFAADRDVGTQPRVRRHLILDRDNKPLASADIREAAWVAVGTDPQGKTLTVQVPTKVTLDWPQQQFKMAIEVRRPKVNEPISPAEATQLFTRPTISGVTPVNLAREPFRPSSYRGATPGDGRRR